MSYVMAVSETMAAAATDVAAIGSTLNLAHMGAAAPTVAVIPAAADEVSASIANLFSRFAQDYHALAGQAAAFNEQFAQHLNASAGSYLAADAANAASLIPMNASAALNVSTLASSASQLIDTASNFLTNLVNYILGLIYYAALVPALLVLLTAAFIALSLGLTILTVAIAGGLFLAYLSAA